MFSPKTKKAMMLLSVSAIFFSLGTAVYAATSGQGIGVVAANVTSNFAAVAKLITAGAYVAGLAFAVAAIVKFKAHKDAPTQVTIGQPIALLFVSAALVAAPSAIKMTGKTMFGTSGTTAGVSGISNVSLS